MASDGDTYVTAGFTQTHDGSKAVVNGCGDLEGRLTVAEDRCAELRRTLDAERVIRRNEATALEKRLALLENEVQVAQQKAGQVDSLDAALLTVAQKVTTLDEALAAEAQSRDAACNGFQRALEELVTQVQQRLEESQAAMQSQSAMVEASVQTLVRRVDETAQRGIVEISEIALESILGRVDEAVFRNAAKHSKEAQFHSPPQPPPVLPQIIVQQPQVQYKPPAAPIRLAVTPPSQVLQENGSVSALSAGVNGASSATIGGSSVQMMATTTPPAGPVVVERLQHSSAVPVQNGTAFPFGHQGGLSARGSPGPCLASGREVSPRVPASLAAQAGSQFSSRISQGGPVASNVTPRRVAPGAAPHSSRSSQDLRADSATQISQAVSKVLGGGNSQTNSYGFSEVRGPLIQSCGSSSSAGFLQGSGVPVRGVSPSAGAFASSAGSPNKQLTAPGAPPPARQQMHTSGSYSTPELTSRGSPSTLHRATPGWTGNVPQGAAGMPFMNVAASPRQPGSARFGSPGAQMMPVRQQGTVTSSPMLR